MWKGLRIRKAGKITQMNRDRDRNFSELSSNHVPHILWITSGEKHHLWPTLGMMEKTQNLDNSFADPTDDNKWGAGDYQLPSIY